MIITLLITSLIFLVRALIVIVPVLLAVAFLTLVERKVLASMQRRVGPSKVGLLGLLQPFADALKLLIKESTKPSIAEGNIFILAPIIALTLSLIQWSIIPMGAFSYITEIDLSILYIFAISSLSVYAVIFAGWSSNSRYAFLGSLRSAAQMISYEVSIGLILISVVLCVGSFNIRDIVNFQEHIWLIIPLAPLFVLFFISALAETNRPPFDLPEAEGELVAGYNVEYASVGFALFFIAEYTNIIFISVITTLIFFGGWLPLPSIIFYIFAPIPTYIFEYYQIGATSSLAPSFIFIIKLVCVLYGFIWVRASFPRYRYDHLMRLGWKILLPLSILYIAIVSLVLKIFDGLPS